MTLRTIQWFSVVLSEMRIVVWCCESCQGVSICLIYGDHIRSRSSSAQTLSQYVTALAQNNTRAGDTGALLSHSLRTNFCWFRNYFSFNVKIGNLLVNRTKSCWYSKYSFHLLQIKNGIVFCLFSMCVIWSHLLRIDCQLSMHGKRNILCFMFGLRFHFNDLNRWLRLLSWFPECSGKLLFLIESFVHLLENWLWIVQVHWLNNYPDLISTQDITQNITNFIKC